MREGVGMTDYYTNCITIYFKFHWKVLKWLFFLQSRTVPFAQQPVLVLLIRISQILLEIQTRMKAFRFLGLIWFGFVGVFLLFQKWSLPLQSEEFKLFVCFDPSMLECLFPPTVLWCIFTIREPAVCFCKWHGLLFLSSLEGQKKISIHVTGTPPMEVFQSPQGQIVCGQAREMAFPSKD